MEHKRPLGVLNLTLISYVMKLMECEQECESNGKVWNVIPLCHVLYMSFSVHLELFSYTASFAFILAISLLLIAQWVKNSNINEFKNRYFLFYKKKLSVLFLRVVSEWWEQ